MFARRCLLTVLCTDDCAPDLLYRSDACRFIINRSPRCNARGAKLHAMAAPNGSNQPRISIKCGFSPPIGASRLPIKNVAKWSSGLKEIGSRGYIEEDETIRPIGPLLGCSELRLLQALHCFLMSLLCESTSSLGCSCHTYGKKQPIGALDPEGPQSASVLGTCAEEPPLREHHSPFLVSRTPKEAAIWTTGSERTSVVSTLLELPTTHGHMYSMYFEVGLYQGRFDSTDDAAIFAILSQIFIFESRIGDHVFFESKNASTSNIEMKSSSPETPPRQCARYGGII